MTTNLLTGVVTAVASAGMVRVRLPGKSTDDLVAVGRHAAGAAVGETMLVAVDGSQAWAVMLLGTAAPAPAPPPIDNDPPPTSVEQNPVQPGSSSLTPTWTGTYRGGGWRDGIQDLYQGDYTGRGLNHGAAFIDGFDALGTLKAVQLRYTRGTGSGVNAAQTPTFVLLGGPKGAGFPPVLGSAAGTPVAVGKSATWTVPSGWLPQLQSGAATGFGISIGSASPYLKLLGSKLWAEVDWERN